jgi:hypothetical protein
LWGPGRFRKALREAVRESRAEGRPGDAFAAVRPPGRAGGGDASEDARHDGGDR